MINKYIYNTGILNTKCHCEGLIRYVLYRSGGGRECEQKCLQIGSFHCLVHTENTSNIFFISKLK